MRLLTLEISPTIYARQRHVEIRAASRSAALPGREQSNRSAGVNYVPLRFCHIIA